MTDPTTDEKEHSAETPVDASEPEAPSAFLVIPSALVMGLLFGTAFAKSHVFEPEVIRAQFLFQCWIMLKMFCGAMGTGALCMAAMSKSGLKQFEISRNTWRTITTSRGLVSGILLGTAILGAGMAVGGACPGMVLSQVGAAVENSYITLIGGLTGALVYGIVEPWVRVSIFPLGPQWEREVFLDVLLGQPYWMLAVGLGVACLAFAGLLEALFPWQDDLPVRLRDEVAACNSPDCVAWPPTVAGILLGTLQVPACLLINTFLGSATSYQVVASLWVLPLSEEARKQFPYPSQFAQYSLQLWWQLPYVLAAVVSTWLWEEQKHDVGKAPGMHAAACFVGGFLMLFGSRMAAGCTSGHGISGCAILQVSSFLGVGAMFGGGIAVAVIWHFAFGGFVADTA